MDSLLGLFGLLFLMFFVLAAAVEAVLETFRGVLEFCGVTVLKGKYTIDDALKLANEFAPGDNVLQLKLEAVKEVAIQLQAKSINKMAMLDELHKDISSAAGTQVAGAAARLNAVASEVRLAIDSSESKRIFILRLLSAIIGCCIVYFAHLPILSILSSSPGAPEFLKTAIDKDIWANVIIGGLGAAAGSSYWHDQLDRVRNLKSAQL